MVEVKEKALLREIYIAAPALQMIPTAVLVPLDQFAGEDRLINASDCTEMAA